MKLLFFYYYLLARNELRIIREPSGRALYTTYGIMVVFMFVLQNLCGIYLVQDDNFFYMYVVFILIINYS
jgi:hypothetical protein